MSMSTFLVCYGYTIETRNMQNTSMSLALIMIACANNVYFENHYLLSFDIPLLQG